MTKMTEEQKLSFVFQKALESDIADWTAITGTGNDHGFLTRQFENNATHEVVSVAQTDALSYSVTGKNLNVNCVFPESW
jgi:hypothetical protein